MIRVLPFLNNPKDLDPSYETDLYFGNCFEMKKKKKKKKEKEKKNAIQ